ncbi:MAG: hypothetical protein NC489_20975 [Ruminococcus flavefaciens]|nr:hypothetical protein [Ruminococcus flavefaciens]
MRTTDGAEARKLEGDPRYERFVQMLCSKDVGKKQKLEMLEKIGMDPGPFEEAFSEIERIGKTIDTGNIRIICMMLRDGESRKDILGVTGGDRKLINAVAEAADGNFSTEKENIERIYDTMHQQMAG